jgi:hypothetical protein
MEAPRQPSMATGAPRKSAVRQRRQKVRQGIRITYCEARHPGGSERKEDDDVDDVEEEEKEEGRGGCS